MIQEMKFVTSKELKNKILQNMIEFDYFDKTNFSVCMLN